MMAIWIKTPPDAEPAWKSELQDAFLRGSRV